MCMIKKLQLLLLVILTLSCFNVQANVIPDNRKINWQLGVNVGVSGGIPNRQTIYTNLAAGSTVAQINSAIQNCPSNQVVKLEAGVFSIGSSITMKSGVTLRGAGSGTNGTILRLSTGFQSAITFGIYGTPSSGTLISTNGYYSGATNLTVASTNGLNVGDLVSISQVLDTNLMWDINGPTSRSVRQQTVIVNKNGSNITIWPALHYGLTPDNTPQMDTFNQSYKIQMSGLEDVQIDGNGQTMPWPIIMLTAVDCWVKNVQIYKTSNYGIYCLFCLKCEFVQVFINDAQNYASNHGGILLGNGSGISASSCAIYDCIFYRMPPGTEINGGSSGNIIAYNFGYDNQLQSYQASSFNINHGPECINNLYEGNIGNMIISDGYFGGSLQDTVFRNWMTGWIPTYPTHGRAAWFRSDSINVNLIGNVFGCTNITPTQRIATPGAEDWDSNYIYIFGDDGSSNGSRGYQPQVTNTMIFHSNWDSVLKAVDWGTNSTHELPNSLYLSSKPNWFGNLQWPPIQTVNGYTNLYEGSIPAGYRFLYGTNPPNERIISIKSSILRTSNGDNL